MIASFVAFFGGFCNFWVYGEMRLSILQGSSTFYEPSDLHSCYLYNLHNTLHALLQPHFEKMLNWTKRSSKFLVDHYLPAQSTCGKGTFEGARGTSKGDDHTTVLWPLLFSKPKMWYQQKPNNRTLLLPFINVSLRQSTKRPTANGTI